ncbi:sensor histidine kinase [Lachnospiraceae bacterium 54-53]
MNLKYKFLVIFLVLSTTPVIFITIFTYSRYTHLIDRQTTEVTNHIFEKAEAAIDEKLDNLNHISELFNFYSDEDTSIINELKKFSGDSSSFNTYDIFQSNKNIRFICQNLIFTYDYINGIFIFTPSGVTLGYGYGGNIDVCPDYHPENDLWYEKTLELDGRFYIDGISEKDFFLNAQPSISFSRALYDVYTKKFLGVLFIDCDPSIFDLSDVNTFPNAALLSVENGSGSILYSNIDYIKTTLTPDNVRLVNKIQFDNGLRLVFAVDYQTMYNQFGATRIIILTISIVCLMVIAVISILVSHYISKPIIHLSQKMAGENVHELAVSSRYLNRTDEIGVLYNEYNRMVETLKKYIEKELQSKLITLDSQMKSLEAQINSHFLYNTLESINSIAELEGVETISTMALALGNMFRYSIKTQSELVTVSDELNHVADYVSIQQIRFDGRFEMQVLVSDRIRSLKVLKLILQPLVENALYHGLQYCHCGSRISIRAFLQDRNICFIISDDGQGMDPQKLDKLEKSLQEKAQFTELGHRNKQSIGIKNIHTRILLYYGEGYGLSIQSKEHEGTDITIRVPVLD